MKTRCWRMWFGMAILVIGMPLSARALDLDGCSNLTLRGDYNFTISGQIFHPDGTVDARAGVAIAHFHGDGTFDQDDFVMSSFLHGPVPSPDTDPATGFHTNETGSYTVNPDCTGKGAINFHNGIVITLMFVVSRSGDTIHTVVSSVTMPNGMSPGTPVIRSDGWRQPRHGAEEASTQGTQGNREAMPSKAAKPTKKQTTGQVKV